MSRDSEGRQDHPLQPVYSWRLKPSLHNQTQCGSSSNVYLHSLQPVPSSSSHSRPQTLPNSKWVRRNRSPHVPKTVIDKKYEVGSSSCSGEVNEQKQEDGEQKEGEDEGGESPGMGQTDLSGEAVGASDLIRDVDDVGSILEKLVLGVEEPELSEDQRKNNAQLQEDELLAMESIYGDNVVIGDGLQGLQSYQIHVHIEVPGELLVTAKLNSLTGPTTESDGANEFSYSFNVKYLPPLVLTCLLPQSYPSHCPPCFTISVQWLDSISISKLCSVLDAMWNEQAGQEIVYPWVEWLPTSCLSYLRFDKEIVLSSDGKVNSQDRRAISGSISLDVDIPSMKSYNGGKIHENFSRNFHECCICFTEYLGTEFIKLPCQHFFCWKCMKTFSQIHVKEGTVTQLLCPETKCMGMVPPVLLKRLLGEEEFKHWESLMLQKTLMSMSDVTYCPRCETFCMEDEDHHAKCPKCYYSFCTKCRDRRHVGSDCVATEMTLEILQERQRSSRLTDEQRKKELEMINDLLSLEKILSDAEQCPGCKMAISRTHGCNKMTCRNCSRSFCYRCNEIITGYDHFRHCVLFPEEMIQNRAPDVNQQGAPDEFQAEVVQAYPVESCPICHQPSEKRNNNNHIFCGACRNYYCYLCKKIIRHAVRHFTPKGCRQHTTD